MNAVSPAASFIAAFTAGRRGGFIGGQWVEPARERIAVINPSTAAGLGEIEAGDGALVDRAVRNARGAFDSAAWRTLAPAARGAMLEKLAQLIEQNGATISELEALDVGLPIGGAAAAAPFAGAAAVRWAAGWAHRINGDVLPVGPSWAGSPRLAYTLKQPIGVVAAIVPWNFPFVMAAAKVAMAVAAGCTVVLKPSELAPYSSLLLADLVKQAGFPDGVLNVVTGGGATGAALVAHEGIARVTFTGSTATGQAIVRAAANDLKRVSLELGGKSPVVVMPDADMARTVPGVALAAFFLSGQNCMCGSRLLVHAKIADQLTEAVAAFARNMKLGLALEAATALGPLISAAHTERVLAHIEAAKRSGARLVAGGARTGDAGFFVQPTIFAGVDSAMPLAQEEIFGPVLAVETFDTDDLDAIAAQANATPYGLGASVWTRDIGKGQQLAARIDAGTVTINAHGGIDFSVPFGGWKKSGWGTEFGREGIEEFLAVKAVGVEF
jgi:phenylacetaldehyde dehydrogenase